MGEEAARCAGTDDQHVSSLITTTTGLHCPLPLSGTNAAIKDRKSAK